SVCATAGMARPIRRCRLRQSRLSGGAASVCSTTSQRAQAALAAAFMACNSKASRPSEPRLHALVGCGVGLRLVVWHNHVLEHGKMLSVERHQWNLPLG